MFRRLVAKLVLALAGLVAGVVLVEIGLRVAGISYPIFWTSDPYRGTALRPGEAGWYRQEGASYVRINSDGLRDVEHTKIKPPNTLRIAILGDSYSEALQVPMEQAFWSVMAHDLANCSRLNGRKVEVINFGVAGYGTAQELLTLRHKVWDYSPDIVVLAFYTENDLQDNSRALKSRGKDQIRAYFVLRGDDLVLDNSFLQSPSYRLRQSWLWNLLTIATIHSRVLQLIQQARVRIDWHRWIKSLKEGPTNNPALTAAIKVDPNDYREPSGPVWQNAWLLTERIILETRNEVAKKGSDFLLVTLSNPIQAYPDPKMREQFMQMTGVQDLFYPDKRLKALGERDGFKVLNLAPTFQAYADKNHVFLHGFENSFLGTGHWNSRGHYLAGTMLAQELCANAQF